MGLIMQVVDVSSVPEEDVQETLTMTAKALENETKCSKLSILLKELGGTLDQDMIPDASLIQGGRVSAIMCKDLYKVVDIMVALQIMKATLAYLSRQFEAGGTIMSGRDLAPGIQTALRRLDVPALNWRAAATAKASSPDLAVDIDKMHAWWVFVTTQIRPRLMRLALGTVLQELAESVTALPETTSYDHFLDDTVYNKALVTKHLLSATATQRLTDNFKVASSAVKHIDDLYTKVFELSPGVKEDTDFSELYEMIWNKKEAFHKDLCCVGAAQIIQNPDEKQQEKGGDMLTKFRSHLPKTIITELEKIVTNGGQRGKASAGRPAKRQKQNV